jgi:hypothetical protein
VNFRQQFANAPSEARLLPEVYSYFQKDRMHSSGAQYDWWTASQTGLIRPLISDSPSHSIVGLIFDNMYAHTSRQVRTESYVLPEQQ